MSAIYRKELRSYFINPIGYVYLGIFLVFSALLCCYTTIVSGTYSTNNYFFFLILSFIKIVPYFFQFVIERKIQFSEPHNRKDAPLKSLFESAKINSIQFGNNCRQLLPAGILFQNKEVLYAAHQSPSARQ